MAARVQTDEPKLTISVAEAAKLSGIGRNHLYDLCHTKGFTALRIGKSFRIHRERFIQWVDEQARVGGG